MRRAVEQAAVDQLMAPTTDDKPGMGLLRRECGLAPISGRPPASMGERYVGVRCGSRSTQRVDKGLLEEYSLLIIVTYRFNGRVPWDRCGQDLMDSTANGFNDFVDAIRLTIHGDLIDNRIIERANAIIEASQVGGGPFARAFEFMGDTDPAEVDGEWFHAVPDRECGIVQELRFGLAERVQSYVSEQGVS